MLCILLAPMAISLGVMVLMLPVAVLMAVGKAFRKQKLRARRPKDSELLYDPRSNKLFYAPKRGSQ
jgi:hypothetical protein